MLEIHRYHILLNILRLLIVGIVVAKCRFYNEIKGTAMGSIFAPTYATLTWRYLEIKLYSVCSFEYGERLAEHIKENWTRFWMTAIQFYGVAKLALRSYYSL